ncbi:hypothetical protein [Hyphomicrobium facile]|uniref:Uncharacterized protein n=1 Tax=Hyphomicrobium facile TaxID=51670 RepID=A0A1I7NEF3_9HYPH|nr:hypothetical protein [Hyphomicrobium facile]SFV32926.1 hypothetical protein SAMN04488557_1775 [Hyphomicrobium facile]
MAYRSKSNLPHFGGALSPWALQLANWGLREIVQSRSHVPFMRLHDHGPVCLIVPTIKPEELSLLVFYGLKRAALAPTLLTASGAGKTLEHDWKRFSRAFVHVQVGMFGQLEGVNHDATLRAANELLRTNCLRTPSLSEIDSALSTSLDLVASSLEQANEKIRHEICN